MQFPNLSKIGACAEGSPKADIGELRDRYGLLVRNPAGHHMAALERCGDGGGIAACRLDP